MKIFISSPMRGKTYEQLINERKQIINSIEPLIPTDVEFINSIIKDPIEHPPLWYLGTALQMLSGADMAVFSKGWDKARGCRIEYQCAKEYGIPTLEIN